MTTGRTTRHLVRPRWVWGGLAVALLGAGLLSLGVMMLSAVPSATGVVLLLLGVAGSVHGGVLHDAVPELSVRRELRQVRERAVHPGVAAGDMIVSERARLDAVASNRRARALQEAAHHPLPADWAPVAGWTCLLLAATLTVSQWNLVAHDAVGAHNSFWDTGWSILLGIAGVRLAATTGRHRVAAAVVLVAGIGLVLGGLLAEHHRDGLAVVQVACGSLAVVCALAAARAPLRGHVLPRPRA